MSTVSDWYVEEYAQDIHNYLRTKERKKTFIYRKASPQLHLRKGLVKWLMEVCDRMDFCITVQHLAVYLLDIFMDNHTILPNHLQMVTLSCLIVAVKREEKDNLIPQNSDYNALVGNKYKLREFVEMEVTVLNFFNWDILYPTAAHFAEYYAIYAINCTDSFDDQPISNIEHFKAYVQKYIDLFLEISLLDTVFRNFYPSVVAAACILATRTSLNFTPPWPPILQNVTLYKYAQLKPCSDLLLNALDVEILASKLA